MKHLFQIILILMLFFDSSLIYASKDEFTLPIDDESEAQFIVEGMIDGKIWKKFSEKEKTVYLFGFEDGVMNTAIHFISDEELKEKICSSLPTSVGGLSIEDVIKQIDEFYSDDKNLNIALYYVLLIIRNRKLGVDEDKIKRYIEYLRGGSGSEDDLKKIIKNNPEDLN